MMRYLGFTGKRIVAVMIDVGIMSVILLFTGKKIDAVAKAAWD